MVVRPGGRGGAKGETLQHVPQLASLRFVPPLPVSLRHASDHPDPRCPTKFPFSLPCVGLLAGLVLSACDGTEPSDRTRQPPEILEPAAGATFRGGDEVIFRGRAFGLQGEQLPASRFTWWAELHHDEHTHPFMPEATGIDSGSVSIPSVGETSSNIFYRFYLAVTYPEGGGDTVTSDLQPETVSFSVVTQPAGLQVTLDGQPGHAPLDVIGVVGIERELGVVSPQTLGESTYAFVSWSNGGAEAQSISTPESPTTYTATFSTAIVGNQPPIVFITTPSPGATLSLGGPITVTATATDPDGAVAVVEFFERNTSVGIDSIAPYQVAWTPALLGPHHLTARASDQGGVVTTSAIIGVTIVAVAGVPTATITSPADQSQGLVGAINISASATDDGGVAGVRFQLDGVDIGPEDVAAPYGVTLPATSAYTSGQHVIRAQARDLEGNLSPWAIATVSFGGNVSLPQGFVRSTFVNLPSLPTTMAFAPDGRLFVSLQSGQLRVVKNGTLLPTPFVTLPTGAVGERGLLGVAFHPNFPVNGWVYVYYTSAVGGPHNRISRFVAAGDTAATGETIIADLPTLSAATNHNGGAIHFGPDGKLYAAVGDNARPSNSPSFAIPFGKILRFNDDGTIPTDNPFFNTATGLNRAIWALGLRNPFTFGFQPGTGRMFVNDVGARAWDEINEGVAGSNYGWPATEGPTFNPSYRSPLYAYQHGAGLVQGFAIVGSAFYNPATVNFPANYVGSYFFADYLAGWIHRLDPNAENGVSIFALIPGLQTDLRVGPDGALYSLAEIGSVWGVQRIAFEP
jgi:glucose/arabinose dehydrogenase